ncbi:YesL family protein [Peribacillus loiseleuriae]|uniref:YesL family protein n=1 Tax=Peribacillus loiseleuriae TaxID=1679170 RepID=UPI003D01F3E4
MTTLNGIFKWVYDLGNWLAKVMYLHFLWVIFTILGLGVFGISPATAALFSVIHEWFDRDFDIPIFRKFYAVYKTQFLKSNKLGIILIGLGVFFYIDMNISKQYIQSFYVHLFLLFIIFLYFLTVLHFFLVFVRYELKFLLYFKQSLFVALARPLETIAMIICLILLFYLFRFLPILLFFAGSSIIAYPLAWFAYRACVQIEEKRLP